MKSPYVIPGVKELAYDPYLLDKIAKYVGQRNGITVDVMKSKTRERSVCTPRHICMFLAYKCSPKMTHEHIGSFFNRDHATVVHGCRSIVNYMSNEIELYNEVEDIKTVLKLKYYKKKGYLKL